MGSPMGKKGTIRAPLRLPFRDRAATSTKPHVDLVPTPIIHERHEERTS